MSKYKTLDNLIRAFFEEFDAKTPSSNELKKQANELASFWIDKYNSNKYTKNFALLVDFDTLLEETDYNTKLISFLKEFGKKLKQHSKQSNISFGRQNFRIIITGCAINNLVNIDDTESFHHSDLHLFKYDSVHNATTKYLNGLNDDEINTVSAHIMYMSSGHPYGMEKLLNIYRRVADINDFLEEETTIIATMNNITDKVRRDIPEKFRDIMDSLSPSRHFNFDLIIKLVSDDLVSITILESTASDEINQKVVDLTDTLTKNYLLSRNNGFLKNSITRRLLAQRLRLTNPKGFFRICQTAFDFYDTQLNSNSERVDRIAIEWLYQKLQLLSNQYSYKNHKKRKDISTMFFNEVTTCLQKLVNNRERYKAIEILDNLEKVLKEDVEFQFTLNYFITYEKYNEDPYKKLEKVINNFRQSMLDRSDQYA